MLSTVVTAIVLIAVVVGRGALVLAGKAPPEKLSMRNPGGKTRTQPHFLKVSMPRGAFPVKDTAISSKTYLL